MQHQVMWSTLRRLAQHRDWLELSLGEKGERLREGWRADFATEWRPVSHWEEFSKWTQTDWQRVVEMHAAHAEPMADRR